MSVLVILGLLALACLIGLLYGISGYVASLAVIQVMEDHNELVRARPGSSRQRELVELLKKKYGFF